MAIVELRMLYLRLCLIMTLLAVSQGECLFPNEIKDKLQLPVVGTTKLAYNESDFILFKCRTNNDSTVFGYIKLNCMNAGNWTEPDRGCTDAIPFNNATLTGVVLFSIAFISVMTFFAFSKRYVK